MPAKRFRATRSWQTIGLSTGEKPAVSHSTSGGTRTRVLEVLGKPLGDENGELVIRLRRGITDHYGHAGPKLVCWLQEQHAAGRWPELKQRYRDLVDEYMHGLEEREGARLTEYIALVAVTVELAHEALDLPWPMDCARQAIQTIWHGAVREAAARPSSIVCRRANAAIQASVICIRTALLSLRDLRRRLQEFARIS